MNALIGHKLFTIGVLQKKKKKKKKKKKNLIKKPFVNVKVL
jgi:hypothetical protein